MWDAATAADPAFARPAESFKRMSSRFAGTCATCGRRMPRGTEIVYVRAHKEAHHEGCYFPRDDDEPRGPSTAPDVDLNAAVGALELEKAPPGGWTDADRVPRATVTPAPELAPARDRAGEALEKVLELFRSDELPAAIASTVIARQESDAPSAQWSIGNQILMILAGTADARGFRQWQEVGRKVVKGSRAFYILAPITRKRKEEADDGTELERVFVSGFRAVPVFRYEDTEGVELERVDYTPATFPPLWDVAQRFGLEVRYAPFVGKFRGYYTPSDHDGKERIALFSTDERVFFHELAHAAHKRVNGALKSGQVASQEIVAETVAATLCQLYGFDGYTAHSVSYVSSYANGENAGRAAVKVLADVQKVLTLILGESGEES